MIRAVTFDLWDTLVVDDSDEATRAARGLPTKPVARREAFAAWAATHGVLASAADGALAEADAAFRRAWTGEHRTPPLRDRLVDAATRLGLSPDDALDDVVETIARMEVDTPPEMCPGAVDALRALRDQGLPLAIISDAIVTPGTHLRKLLAVYGLDGFFDAFVFSDEAGASKPDPSVFHQAAEALGVPVEGLLHVGDRESNDVRGVQGVRGRAVLYVGAKDRRGEAGETAADAVCDDLHVLPDLVAGLSGDAR